MKRKKNSHKKQTNVSIIDKTRLIVAICINFVVFISATNLQYRICVTPMAQLLVPLAATWIHEGNFLIIT